MSQNHLTVVAKDLGVTLRLPIPAPCATATGRTEPVVAIDAQPKLKDRVLEWMIQCSEQALMAARRELKHERMYLQLAAHRDHDRHSEAWSGLERCARAHVVVRREAAELRRLRRWRTGRLQGRKSERGRLHGYGGSLRAAF